MAKKASNERAQRRAVQRLKRSMLVAAQRDVRARLSEKRADLEAQGVDVDKLGKTPWVDLDFDIKVTDPEGRDITHEAIIE